jgi:hypothetical protein
MNIKRIAWESRGVEHRTIPADQRMAGISLLPAPEAIEARTNMAQVRQAFFTPRDSEGLPLPPVEAVKSGVSAASAEGEQTKVAVLPDRAAIAQVVEHVMAAHGIARGSGAPKPVPAAKELPSPSAVAAEIAGRLFGSPGRPKGEPSVNSSAADSNTAKVEALVPSANPPKAETSAKPVVQISPFVSENDVRRAMTRSEKIFIGPKTILTPSARDLGLEHEVFVETEAGCIR